MKLKSFIILAAAAVMLSSKTALAKVGDMGFFGGISEGRRLPKATELLLAQTTTTRRNNSSTNSFIYKETMFISGKPVVFEGLLAVSTSGGVSDTVDAGSYTETYKVSSSATTSTTTTINRNIVFNVKYRRNGTQIIKDYEVSRWTEVLTTPEGTYTIDASQSKFNIGIIEDHRAGIVYYRGDINQHGVYTGDASGTTTVSASGSFYGYECAWSSTETHRLDVSIYNNDWQMQYQVRPSVSVSKSLQYVQNEPTAISFAGNYKEVFSNSSGLRYDIFVMPRPFYDQQAAGGADIATINASEQLIAPDTSYLKGHFAEEDIRRLFSMQVLEGDAKFFQPNQAITRSQYITALVKAIKLPIEDFTPTTTTSRNNKQTVTIVFPDVTSDRPDYNYIMTAYKAGIAVGRSNGYFYADSPIERQEALTVLIRALGLQSLAPDPAPVTIFTDDAKIGGWARRELYAAELIGLISGDADGNIRPTELISKAEAAAILNRLITYMSSDIARDYADHIVNYVY